MGKILFRTSKGKKMSKIITGLKRIKRTTEKSIRDYKYNKAAKRISEKPLEYGLNTVARDEEVIVSLTSYGRRLSSVNMTIRSIFNQTYKPDKVVLYLDSDVSATDLPKTLTKLKEYGLDIRQKQENIRSHKKYFYAVQEFPASLIVTVDDDLLYPPDLIENLVKMHTKYPKAVIAGRVHKMCLDENGVLLPYRKWGWEADASQSEPSFSYIATGCGGVLYPPNSLASDMLNIELIQKLALQADDLWLKVAEVKAHTPVKMAEGLMWRRTYEEPSAELNGLSNTNVAEDKNDSILRDIMNYYGLTGDFLFGESHKNEQKN